MDTHNTPELKNTLLTTSLAFLVSRSLHTAAALGIADCLVQGPLHISIIAQTLGVHEQSLYRLMRMLAGHDIFQEQSKNIFGLTPLAELLVSSHPHSVRGILMHEDEPRWRAYGMLTESIKTGIPAFNIVHKQDYFDFLSSHPESAKNFDDSMATISAEEDRLIAQSLTFDKPTSIIDVGGGKGGLIGNILKNNHHCKGTIYELGYVYENAQTNLHTIGVADRCQFITGNFMQTIPAGADVYLLKRILHDWNDQTCLTILKNCKLAMNPLSKLFVMDAIVKEGNTPDVTKDIDILMLSLFKGKERTKDEFYALFEQAGLTIVAITSSPTALSIIEAKIKKDI